MVEDSDLGFRHHPFQDELESLDIEPGPMGMAIPIALGHDAINDLGGDAADDPVAKTRTLIDADVAMPASPGEIRGGSAACRHRPRRRPRMALS